MNVLVLLKTNHVLNLKSSFSPPGAASKKTNKPTTTTTTRLYSHLYLYTSIHSCMKCGLRTVPKWAETSKRNKTQRYLLGDPVLPVDRAGPRFPAAWHLRGAIWLVPTKGTWLEMMGYFRSKAHKSKCDFSTDTLSFSTVFNRYTQWKVPGPLSDHLKENSQDFRPTQATGFGLCMSKVDVCWVKSLRFEIIS